MQSTYSFLDSVMVFAHPLLSTGAIVITGEGVGTINVSMNEARTAMDVAADGAVMVSKMAGNTGTLTISVQQTSLAHKKLLALFNLLIGADTFSWAQAMIIIRNVTDGTGHIATGVAFTKIGDKSYAKQGGQISWNIMAADIQSLTV